MFGSAGKTPAANGGIRGRGNNSDDDDDEDDDEDRARFTKSSISIEQVSWELFYVGPRAVWEN